MTPFPHALFIGHGGGPLPLLGDPGHQELVATLQEIAASIPRPKAILVVSAHWEAPLPTLTAAPKPELLYDYYNFPPEAYSIQYPCPGDPQLAHTVAQRLRQAGFSARLDDRRGFDHGVFIPLKIMYPQADIPCVQLSLLDSLDPAEHIALGEALPIEELDQVLILGSGFSFHNLRAFFGPISSDQQQANARFESWLARTCTDPALSEEDRRARLIHWDDTPDARYCHPRPEHLLPLHVCYGAARSPSRKRYALRILGVMTSMYLW